jgi:prepilin-type N-terminal cleavage/methylation domain-containing protein
MIQRKTRKQRSGYGFTLLEVIVVVAIIAALAAIAVPMLSVAFKQAKKTRAAADMQTISVALEAYKTDFGDYPRPEVANAGFAVLTKALIAPGKAGAPAPALGTAPYSAGTVAYTGTPGQPSYTEHVAFGKPAAAGGFSTATAPTDATTWAVFPYSDGKDGPGFRARYGGKTYGPYLPEGKFKLNGLAMLDSNDNPILYFVGSPRKMAQDTTLTNTWALLTGGAASVYNAFDNISFFMRPGESLPGNAIEAMKRLDAVIVQDSNDFNGIIKAGETARTTGPFVLWSAGADGNFGVTYDVTGNPVKNDIKKCDDITNFER